MYQLIVSDYDGTLVENDKPITNSFYTKVNMLAARGIIFAVASGRPYNQLKKLLYPISNETVFISDDGAQVMYHNCLLYKNVVPMNAAKEISKLALNNGMVPIVSLREENKSVSEEKLSLPFFFSSDIFKVIIVKNGKSTDEIKTNTEKLNLRVCYEDDTYIEFCNKIEAIDELLEISFWFYKDIE